MKITINRKTVELADGATVADALASQGISGVGIAVAVDNKVVSRPKWAETSLWEGAVVNIITAVCGG